jgi:hypothetical protein
MYQETRRNRPRLALFTTAFMSIASVTAALFRERLGRLLPIFIGLVLIAVLMAAVTASGPLAPFIYPLF